MRGRPRFKAHSITLRTACLISVLSFTFTRMPRTFTPTPEQLALREARRLQKEKAASSTTTPSSLVNNAKGQILPRPWLALQDSPTNATRTAKIMTWNVRNFVFFSVPVYTALDR